MTFIEAAAYVLEKEGRPLHSREIAEKAVDFGILSHVGKTPVQTMSARLSATVAKERGKGPFVRIRPGVFGLSSWQGQPPGPAKPKKEAEQTNSANQPQVAAKTKESQPSGDQAGPVGSAGPKKRKRRKRKVSNVSASAPNTANSGRPEKGAQGDSAPPQSPSPSSAPPLPDKEGVAKGKPADGAPTSKSPKSSFSKGPVTSSHFEKGARGEHQDTLSSPASPAGEEDVIDRVESMLKRSTRPVPSAQLFEQVGLKGESAGLLLDAMITADGFDRSSRGLRPRFVKYKNGYGLVEREISAEITALERQAVEARKRLVHIAERQVLRKLRSLPMNGFVRGMILYLQRSGFGSMIPIDLSRKNEFHLSVQDRRHQGRFRTAVVLRKDPAEHVVTQRMVMDLRGAIHHYDAMGGMILTTGQVNDAAIKEGRISNLPPVSLVDGETLAAEMARLGIGVKEREIKLPAFDEGFFNTLEH